MGAASRRSPAARPLVVEVQYASRRPWVPAAAAITRWAGAAHAVAPLAFMRGRSLNDSFIILDEAQNTTVEQMKMFLTRLGFGSRAVVTGDITQIDLPRQQRSGLRHAIEVLRGVEGVAFTFFNSRDVVRHPLVQRIVQAYERAGDAQGTEG